MSEHFAHILEQSLLFENFEVQSATNLKEFN